MQRFLGGPRTTWTYVHEWGVGIVRVERASLWVITASHGVQVMSGDQLGPEEPDETCES